MTYAMNIHHTMSYVMNIQNSIAWCFRMYVDSCLRDVLEIMERVPAMKCDTGYELLSVYIRVLLYGLHGNHMTKS